MSEPVEVYRSSVRVWECDQMGHLNVQFYLDKADLGLQVLSRRLGLSPKLLDRHRARVHTSEHHVRFIREQYAGAPLALRAGVTGIDDDRLELYMELVNPARDETAASFLTTARLRQEDGRFLPLPESVREHARTLMTNIPLAHAPQGVHRNEPRPAPTLSEAEAMGMMTTYLGPVEPGMCADDGALAVRSYMGVVSDGVAHLLARIRDDGTPDHRLGGAALEYRWIYHTRPKLGDLLTLRSAITHIGNKAYRLGHWLFDAETGQAVATTEAVAVILDLEARRAMVIPDGARRCLEGMLVEGFHL